jgi:ketosteroid isomerase-like protein
MFKAMSLSILLATSGVAHTGEAQLSPSQQAATEIDEAAIRTARNELNEALAARNPAGLAKYWLENVHTTLGGGGSWVGRDENVEGYAEVLRGRSFLSGLRTPKRIEVATGGPLEAAESGLWKWRVRESGEVVVYRGRYLVMWQKVEGSWKIRSELYVITGCEGGAACAPAS